ncbi:hypothetical protein TSAR_007183 [Trichomalopsis sarcophagae]|uniref:N-acetyltransferase domain-containing protein n=1 Tax=Trichomalopsis sarcophagae TaxID=543379 RepID=A0A232FJD2_9HYME|nr:hypothetical protein TSAR_007183 [Trichomalopsis sarcophagae]
MDMLESVTKRCLSQYQHKSNSTTTSIEENVDENMKHPATRDLMKFVFKSVRLLASSTEIVKVEPIVDLSLPPPLGTSHSLDTRSLTHHAVTEQNSMFPSRRGPQIESSVDLYEHYGCNYTMEVFYVGVDSRYRRYGIAQNLMRSSLEMARKIALERALPEPEVAFGVFTSNYSQALAEKFGFEWLYSVNYDDYECYDGKMLSDRIGPVHKCAKLAARKL